MSNIVERSTWHTGKRHLKSGKAYDPGHNGNEKGRALQEHIDQSKFNKNIYYYLDLETGKMKRENGGHGGVDFKKIEREFAKKNFKEGLDNINERYRKSGHSEDVKTLTQYLNSKPPMEIISELGGVGSQIPLKERGEILVDATTKVMRIAQKTWPDNLQVLDQAFHGDEGLVETKPGIKEILSNHMHTRVWFFINGKDPMRDKKGNILYNEDGTEKKCKVVNQTAALREMGFGIPQYKKGMTKEQLEEAVRNPENWGKFAQKTELYKMCQEQPELLKHTKICSPVVAFTDFMREQFNNELEIAAKARGIDLTIEREAKNVSYRKLVKDGEVDLSKDVLSDLDRADEYKTPAEFKAAREEERARIAEHEYIQAEIDKAQTEAEIEANKDLIKEQDKEIKSQQAQIDVLSKQGDIIEKNIAEKRKIENKAKLEAQRAVQAVDEKKSEIKILDEKYNKKRERFDLSKDAMEAFSNKAEEFVRKGTFKWPKEYEVLPEKKNWKGEVVRPECVVVDREAYESMKEKDVPSKVDTYTMANMNSAISDISMKLDGGLTVRTELARAQQNERAAQLSLQRERQLSDSIKDELRAYQTELRMDPHVDRYTANQMIDRIDRILRDEDIRDTRGRDERSL